MGDPEQVPLEIALLIDVSGSTHTRFDFEKTASDPLSPGGALKKDDQRVTVHDRPCMPVLKQVDSTADVASLAHCSLRQPQRTNRVL